MQSESVAWDNMQHSRTFTPSFPDWEEGQVGVRVLGCGGHRGLYPRGLVLILLSLLHETCQGGDWAAARTGEDV